MHQELNPPPEVASAEWSRELIRAFAADGSLHVSLSPDAWPDAGPWGVLFADLAKHVANAREQQLGVPPAETLAEIRLAFEKQWGWDTDGIEGEIPE